MTYILSLIIPSRIDLSPTENSVKIRDEITLGNKKIIRIYNEKGNKEEDLILDLYPKT
jgi:hypothetical protein